MIELLGALVALSVGAAVGWLAARGHLGALARAEREAAQIRLTSAESVADDLRKQLTEREFRLGDLAEELASERTQRVQAETRWAAARENLEEQRRLVDEARERLAETFRALSEEALHRTGGAWVDRATQALAVELERRDQAVQHLVRPLEEALRRAEAQVHELERSRQHAYGSLEEQLRALADQSRLLQRETSTLASALRSSQARGRWGEVTLRRVVELAGMTEHCDFVEQPTLGGDAGRLRPDLIVRLPGGREIVVDAKVPLAAYLDAVSATTPEARSDALGRHARDLRGHMVQLAGRGYAKHLPQSADLVVMFIPGEVFVTAAVEADPDLIVDAMERRVVVATPMILFALLAAVAHGWQQQLLARSADEVRRLGQELYERLATLGAHFRALGQSLGKAVEAYNDAVGSVERRVLPAARRFRDLGAGTREEVPAVEPLEQTPRPLRALELAEQMELDPETRPGGDRPVRSASSATETATGGEGGRGPGGTVV